VSDGLPNLAGFQVEDSMPLRASLIFYDGALQAWNAGFYELASIWALIGYWSALRDEVHARQNISRIRISCLHEIGRSLRSQSSLLQYSPRATRVAKEKDQVAGSFMFDMAQVIFNNCILDSIHDPEYADIGADSFEQISRMNMIRSNFQASKYYLDQARSMHNPGSYLKAVEGLALSYVTLSLGLPQSNRILRDSVYRLDHGPLPSDTMSKGHEAFCLGLHAYIKQLDGWMDQFRSAEQLYSETEDPLARYYHGLLHITMAIAHNDVQHKLDSPEKQRMKALAYYVSGKTRLCGDHILPYSLFGLTTQTKRKTLAADLDISDSEVNALRRTSGIGEIITQAEAKMNSYRAAAIAQLFSLCRLGFEELPQVIAQNKDSHFHSEAMKSSLHPFKGDISKVILLRFLETLPALLAGATPSGMVEFVLRFRDQIKKYVP